MTDTPTFAAASPETLGGLSGAPPAGGVLFAVFQNGSKANGGVESLTQIIAGLRGQPRVVLTNAETPATARWRDAGAEAVVWNLPYATGQSWCRGGFARLARRVYSLLATNWWVWRTLRERRLMAVHCNDPAPFWHVAIGARLAGVPLLWNLRDTKSDVEGLNVARYRRRFRWCARALVLSREMREFYARALLLRNGRAHPPIDFIYSVVDSARMYPLPPEERLALRSELGIAEGTFAIGFIATFNDKKNQLGYLREAVPTLAARYPSAKTFFIGDFEPKTNPYALGCLATAAALRIENRVRFAGFCLDVQRWYQACDVVVVPTRKEGLARCMIEALACGTPVVSFDVASAREILETHGCGRVVAQGDYAGLCGALAGLAENPALRVELSAAGVDLASRLFSAGVCLDQYRRLLLLTGQNNSVSLPQTS